jgi:hypothetical protein
MSGKMLDVDVDWVIRIPNISLWSVLFGRTPHGHMAGSLPEKGPGDSIIQPAPSGVEGSFASGRVYTQNGFIVTVSSGGSCGNWLDAGKI